MQISTKLRFISPAVLLGWTVLTVNAGAPESGPKYSSDGQLRLPADYRDWVYLPSGFDMSYNPAMAMDHHMFDNVFVNPEAWRVFKASGT